MAKDPAKVSAYNHAYWRANKARLSAKQKEVRAIDRNERLRKRRERYAAVHPRRVPLTAAEISARYKARHPEKVAARQKAYWQANKVRLSARQKERNRDEINARRRAEYARNRDAHAARAKARREANPETFLEYKRRYYSTEHGRLINRASAHRRRLYKTDNSATIEELMVILSARSCYLCGKKFTKANPATVEHVIALAEGGSNDASNLAAAHLSCNSRKWTNRANPFTGQGLLL